MRFRSVRWPADGPSLEHLLASAEAVDGRPALSEFKFLRAMPLREGQVGLVAMVDGGIAGYGHASPHPGGWGIEVVLCPDMRTAENYAALIVETVRELPGDADFGVWAVDETIGRAARLLGMSQRRALEQLRRPLPAPHADVPARYTVRSFRVGVDEDAWLEANQAAFADHPENSGMTHEDLTLRMRQPWFDPEGFLLAWDDDRLAGFCWMKEHGGGVAEIYIIGVRPEYRGEGLGTALALSGLEFAVAKGAGVGMLYVEADNHAGLALYGSLGFERHLVNRLYAPAADD